MYIIVQAVVNHIGPVPFNDPQGFANVSPFNSSQYYHGCSQCAANCSIIDFANQKEVEICRYYGLPDLDQSHPFVANATIEWVKILVDKYRFDGIQFIATPEVR